MVLTERGVPVGRIRDHDAVVFCCRRGEREIELTELFTADDFRAVERRKLKDLYFAILTLYHDKFKHLPVAFAPEHVVKPLAQVLSEAGKTQFHCAESEKFAHVTFFFNGGENTSFPGEEDVCVPSPKGIDFDQKPELSLPEWERTVTDSIHQLLQGPAQGLSVHGEELGPQGHIQSGTCPLQRGIYPPPGWRRPQLRRTVRAKMYPKAAPPGGSACHRNPLCIVVPCHRVIGADGSLTGYAEGLEIKEYLLELERF